MSFSVRVMQRIKRRENVVCGNMSSAEIRERIELERERDRAGVVRDVSTLSDWRMTQAAEFEARVVRGGRRARHNS